MSKPAPGRPYGDVPGFPQSGEIDLRELVDRPGNGAKRAGVPLELEVGFGRGKFLLQRAEENPGTLLVGIETRRKWVGLVGERARRRELENVVVRHGNARQLLPRIVPDGCLSRVFVNFPDPWWKARHAKRMLVTADFVRQVARLLADRGEFFLQTDVEFRAEQYRYVCRSVPQLVARELSEARGSANPYGIRSTREHRCEEIGLTVHRFLFVRTAH
jgi:tRNA (guanine-N7-)-methyltransferase